MSETDIGSGELPEGIPPGLKPATNPFAGMATLGQISDSTAAQKAALQAALAAAKLANLPGLTGYVKRGIDADLGLGMGRRTGGGLQSPPQQLATWAAIDFLYVVHVPVDGPPTCEVFSDWDALVLRLQEIVGQDGYAFAVRGERLRIDGGDTPALHTPWGPVALQKATVGEIPDGWLGKRPTPDAVDAPADVAVAAAIADTDDQPVFPNG